MSLDNNDIVFLDDLLCQRAVQTQLYYFAEFRDGSVDFAVSSVLFFSIQPIFLLHGMLHLELDIAFHPRFCLSCLNMNLRFWQVQKTVA